MEIETIINVIENYGYFLKNKRKYYADEKVKNYINPIMFKTYQWKLLKTNHKETSYKITLNTFISNDCILKACYVIDEYDDYHEFIGLFTPEYTVIVSVVSGHPRVETTDIIYENSDGSGPDIITDINNPILLMDDLIKYYHEFLNNDYH